MLVVFYIVVMVIKDVKIGLNEFRKYVVVVNFLWMVYLIKKRDEFKEKLKNSMYIIIKDIKLKKFFFVYFVVFIIDVESGEYIVMGWICLLILKYEFEIVDDFVNKIVFMVIYNDKFNKLYECCVKVFEGYIFCFSVVDCGDNGLIFIGSNEGMDKVILEENIEVYGMGGDDYFELKLLGSKGIVKIDGGVGSDNIDVINFYL